MSQTEPEYVATWDDEPEPDYDSEPLDLPANEVEALQQANRHLRHVASIRAERARLVANFDAEIRRLEMRRDTKVAQFDRQEQWWARPVLSFHRMLRLADESRTSITLACGVLRSQGQQPEWKYGPDEQGNEHPEEFVAWALEHYPELVAPVTVGVRVPASDAAVVVAKLTKELPGLEVQQTPMAPAKAEVKKALVKKDEKGKHVLARGIDPTTGEAPPGLTVTEREPEFSLDTDTE